MLKTKVLLLSPPSSIVYGNYKKLYKTGFLNPPIHLCYLAASLEKAGHDVRIIDGDVEVQSIEKLIKMIGDYDPALIGITSTSIDFNITVQIIQQIKKTFPKIQVILGGTHCNIYGKTVLELNPEIDYACIGDGEELIVELVNSIKNGNHDQIGLIKGLIHREESAVIENEPRQLKKNIDDYQMPARHLLKNESYYRAVPYSGYQTTTALMSSRGCPYNCVYCAVKNIKDGSVVRLRSAENVIDEVEYIVNKLNIRHIAFNDDCLTLSKKRIYKICEAIQRKRLKFTWEGLSRADLVDRNLLKTMKKAGFVRISYGIESGNPLVLHHLNKGESLDQITEAFKLTAEAGIVARGSVIIGSPYEDRKKVLETFKFIRKLKGLDQVVINIMQPYPGTKVREIFLDGLGGAHYLSNPDDLTRLKRFGSASIAVNDLTPRDLVILQKIGFLMFYLRPQALMNNLRISGWGVFWKDGTSFLRSIVGL